MSHELRTPLAVIAAVFENIGRADAALRASSVGEGRTALDRLNRLVKNLLDQTRLESGALRPHEVWCSAHDLVEAARASTREALAGHPLEVVIPDDLPPLFADFPLTEEALANLLLNAAVHTLVATPIFLTAGTERGGQRIFFTVADRGPGFPPAMRERLFKEVRPGRRGPGGRPWPGAVDCPRLHRGPGRRGGGRGEPRRRRRDYNLPAARTVRPRLRPARE